MSRLIEFDHQLFRWINSQWTHPLLDQFFPFWTDFTRSPAFYLALPIILGLIFYYHRWKGIGILLAGVAITSLADKIFGSGVKQIFQRLRPEFANLPFEVLIKGPSQSGYSFPSSHAVDAFCLAGFILFYYPKARLPLIIFAGLTAYSRVYCGYHFPSDILVGSLAGFIFGWLGAVLIKSLFKRVGSHKK